MAENDSPIPEISPWIIAISVMTATFMVVLDTTVVNVSLPHISGSLSATIEETTWVLTSYLAANAVVLPLTGWIANLIGRKRLLMLSVAGFTSASFLCGLAPNLPVLIAFRIIQGATGGALQPLSQSIMLEAFHPEQRGKAMGFWGLGIVVAPMLGPVIGGWLTDSYSWRWVFYINIPVGIVSLMMIRRYIFDPHYIGRGPEGVDYTGIGLLVIGVASLQIVLDKGQQEDWFTSDMITFLAVVAGVSLVVFVVHEVCLHNPVLHLKVFKERTYAAGTFLMTALGFVLFGSLVIIPILLQTLLGYPSLQAGYATAPRGLGSFVAMPIVGYLTSKVDPRKLLALGLIFGGITLIQLSWINLQIGYWDIFWPQFFQGIAMGLLFVPLTTVTMDPIPREEMGNATSIFNLLRNIGGSIGIAAVTTMLARRQQVHTQILGSHISLFDTGTQIRINRMRQMFMSQGADFTTATRRTYAALFGAVQQQAAILTFVDLFRLLGWIFLICIPLVLLLKRPKERREATAAVAE